MCRDPERAWYPQRIVCYATMETDAARARWQRLHDDKPWHNGRFEGWSADPSTATPYFRDMGVTIWAAEVDLNPDDDFLGDVPVGAAVTAGHAGDSALAAESGGEQ